MLLDEADYFIYNKIEWLKTINVKIIGFTGTCGSSSELDSELQLMKQMKFKILKEEGCPPEDPKTISDVNFFTDHTSPLIIFAHKEDFPKYEEALHYEYKYEDEDVETVVKNRIKNRTLILISDPLFMRGYDFRANGGISLLIAKSFSNMRDAQQGLGRVGRFGDPC